MFYDETKTINACESDPLLLFELLKQGDIALVDKILSRKTFDINVFDSDGNSILMKLLKKGQYELVLKHIKDKRWDVNHQNKDGDTFAHILVTLKGLIVIDIYKELKKNKKFIPNIKNNLGETILDKAVQNDYMCITAKILEDSRFNEIGIFSFKKLYDTYIKTNIYGKYTRVNNLQMIIDNLEDREISPRIKQVINYIKNNFDIVKADVMNNNTKDFDMYLKRVLFE